MNNRFTTGVCLKYFYLPFILLAFSFNAFSQLQLTSVSPNAFIDFSATMPVSVSTSPTATAFIKDFVNNPTTGAKPGALNSNAWSINGSAYPSAISTTGVTSAPVNTGGIYAYQGSPGSAANPSLMIQASGTFFQDENLNPIDLRILNNDPTRVMTKIDINYDLFVRNDQARASTISFYYSVNNTSWTAIGTDYTSPATGDALGWVKVGGPGPSRTINITGISVAPTKYIYLRWNYIDAGSGSRDEIGLDNIDIKSTFAAPCTGPTTGASVLTFTNVLAQQMDIGFTRGNGTGVMVVASTTNTAPTPANTGIYMANSTYGSGDAIGSGFVVYNGNSSPVNFTLFGLNPSTTYYFWVFEYLFPTSPCYITVPRTGSRITGAGSGTQPTHYFKTRQNGAWNNAATWSSSPDNGATWVNSTLKPTSAAGQIEILNSVTLTGNESAKNLFIRNGGIIDNGGTSSTGGYTLTFAGSGTQFTIQNGGKFSLWGKAPVMGTALAEIESGGIVEASGNTSGESDNLAFSSSAFTFRTGSIFNWNTSLGFESSNKEYFKDISEIPIFRISHTPGNPGASANTKIYGVLDVQANITWQNTGKKYFRNGITGSATLGQDATSGTFVIDGLAEIGGAGVINLDGAGMEITSRNAAGLPVAKTTLTSNKTINGTSPAVFNVLGTGQFFTENFVLSGSIPFNLSSTGTLGIGSPQGITTGASGNIQTAVRTFDPGGYYYYNATSDQVTGNALPSTICQLTIAATGKTVTLSQPALTISGASSRIMLYSSNFLIPGKTVTFEGGFYSDPTPSGWIEGDPNSIVILSGAQNQIPLFKDKTSMGKIIFKRSGTGILNFINDINIYTGLEFDPSHSSTVIVNFNSKNITLKSTPTFTAYLGKQTANYISGADNFTIERYIPSDAAHGKSWQLLAVPLNPSSTQTINAAWQEGATTPLANPNPGYGTIITGKVPNATDPTIGFDIYTAPDATVKTYVPATDQWVSITNTKTLKVATNSPYLVLVRGDRSITTYNAPSIPTTLRTKGKVYYGISTNNPPALNLTKNKFSAVSNPYASSIDFQYIFENYINDLDPVYYAWDPLLPGSYGLGGYQTISATNGYKPVPGGTTTYPTGVPAKIIQSGQGFLVHSTDPTLTSNPLIFFNEDQKVTNYNMVFRPEQSNRVSLTSNLFTGSGKIADANVVVYNTNYSNHYDKFDAKKYKQEGENFGIISNSELLTLEARSSVKEKDTLQFFISNLKASNYIFKFQPENFNVPLKAFLNDRFLGSKQEISLTDSTIINFLVSADDASKSATRFFITFAKNSKSNYNLATSTPFVEIDRKEIVNIFPNPITNNFFTVQFTDFEPGDYKLYFLSSIGSQLISKTIKISTEIQSEKFELPSSTLPGIYKFIVESVRGKKTYGVIVN